MIIKLLLIHGNVFHSHMNLHLHNIVGQIHENEHVCFNAFVTGNTILCGLKSEHSELDHYSCITEETFLQDFRVILVEMFSRYR